MNTNNALQGEKGKENNSPQTDYKVLSNTDTRKNNLMLKQMILLK